MPFEELDHLLRSTQAHLVALTVLGGEPLKIVLANGGLKPAAATGTGAKLEPHPAGGDLAVLVIDRPENGQVSWGVEYQK